METNLPPIVEGIKDGNILYKPLANVDYGTIGFVLICHLIIEHYMGEFLKTKHPDLYWSGARLKFIKMVELLSKYPDKEDNLITPSLRCLNTLRNKFSHDMNYKMQDEDLQPLVLILKRFNEEGESIPTNKIEILCKYTYKVCLWLAQALELTVNWVPFYEDLMAWAKQNGINLTSLAEPD